MFGSGYKLPWTNKLAHIYIPLDKGNILIGRYQSQRAFVPTIDICKFDIHVPSNALAINANRIILIPNVQKVTFDIDRFFQEMKEFDNFFKVPPNNTGFSIVMTSKNSRRRCCRFVNTNGMTIHIEEKQTKDTYWISLYNLNPCYNSYRWANPLDSIEFEGIV